MEARGNANLGNQDKYQVDLEKVNRAFAKVGATNKLLNAPTEEEFRYLCRRQLSVLQWQLRELYKIMLDEELLLCKDEFETMGTGRRVYTSSGHLKDRMNQNAEIAEKVFANWAKRIGVSHLYAESLGADASEVHDVLHRVYNNSSGLNVYERFDKLLRSLV